MEKKWFCREELNLKFVIFDFFIEHLHENIQKAWEYLNIKLLRKVEDINFDVFVYKINILTGSGVFLVRDVSHSFDFCPIIFNLVINAIFLLA